MFLTSSSVAIVTPSYIRKMFTNEKSLILCISGKRGGSVVSASDLGPEGREFMRWPVHPRCVLRKNT